MCKGKEYVASIDAGKWGLKLMGRAFEDTLADVMRVPLRSKIHNLANGPQDVEGEGSYKVELDGQAFVVGDLGTEESYKSSKESEVHRLEAYTAITRLLEPGSKGNKIYVVLACPITTLKNDALKESYKSFIKGNGVVNIKVDDLDYEFEIMDITIKAEGSGITISNPEIFAKKVVGVIDIGGLNWGFSRYDNGSCSITERFADDHGATSLVNYIAEDLVVVNEGSTVSTADAERALEVGYTNKGGTKNPASVEAIKQSKARFLRDGMKSIERHLFDVDKLDSLVFVGGTTLRLEEQISDMFPKAHVPSNAQWATAEGLYTIAVNKYVKPKK